MRLVFIGSSSFGLPTLRSLTQAHELLAVYTKPDQPAGRGYQLTASPIKEEALRLKLPVRHPQKINEAVDEMTALQPDALIVVSFGQILRRALLEIPKLGVINLHASLLPAYRGAAPIQWALLRGETQTGVTTFLIDEGLDTGPMLLQRACPIADEATSGTLEPKLATLGADLMLETLEGLEQDSLQPTPQDDAHASYAPKIAKAMGQIDWSKPAREIFNLIRALNPTPGAYTFYEGKRLKIHASRIVEGPIKEVAPGQIVGLSPDGFLVMAGDRALELLEVQPESKPRMKAIAFVQGYRVSPGRRLGNEPR
jgi:methionyl-tRNA formyltransferase